MKCWHPSVNTQLIPFFCLLDGSSSPYQQKKLLWHQHRFIYWCIGSPSVKPAIAPAASQKVLAAHFALAMVFGSMLELSSSSLASLMDGASQKVKIAYGLACWFHFGNTLFSQILQRSWTPATRSMSRYAQTVIHFLPIILAVDWLPWLIASFPGMFMGTKPS